MLISTPSDASARAMADAVMSRSTPRSKTALAVSGSSVTMQIGPLCFMDASSSASMSTGESLTDRLDRDIGDGRPRLGVLLDHHAHIGFHPLLG